MSVTVHIHKTHRHLTGGLAEVAVEGRTVGDCLRDLVGKYPGMAQKVFDPSGSLNRSIDIYVNAESAHPEELQKKVNPGDDVYLTLLLAGG